MPNYDYRCNTCNGVFETNHQSDQSPVVLCPTCGTADTKKILTCCNLTRRRLGGRDAQKRQADIRAELKEDYMVHGVAPVAAGNLEEVYKDIKANGSLVKEQMQRTVEQNAQEAVARQQQWRKNAQPRAQKKIQKIREDRAKEAATKSTIRL